MESSLKEIHISLQQSQNNLARAEKEKEQKAEKNSILVQEIQNLKDQKGTLEEKVTVLNSELKSKSKKVEELSQTNDMLNKQ